MLTRHNAFGFKLISLFSIILVAIITSGCTGAAAVATSVADSNQKPSVAQFRSKQTADKLFTASVKSLTPMGQILNSDRSSGVVQGKKGLWVISASVFADKSGSTVAVTARFVPGNQFDFNSREKLTQEFVAGVEAALGEKLEPFSG